MLTVSDRRFHVKFIRAIPHAGIQNHDATAKVGRSTSGGQDPEGTGGRPHPHRGLCRDAGGGAVLPHRKPGASRNARGRRTVGDMARSAVTGARSSPGPFRRSFPASGGRTAARGRRRRPRPPAGRANKERPGGMPPGGMSDRAGLVLCSEMGRGLLRPHFIGAATGAAIGGRWSAVAARPRTARTGPDPGTRR